MRTLASKMYGGYYVLARGLIVPPRPPPPAWDPTPKPCRVYPQSILHQILPYPPPCHIATQRKRSPRAHHFRKPLTTQRPRPPVAVQQVTFDEKSPADLLQQLNEIFTAIDPQQTSEQDEPSDAGTTRMVSFLVMLKFPVPEHEREVFRQRLAVG